MCQPQLRNQAVDSIGGDTIVEQQNKQIPMAWHDK